MDAEKTARAICAKRCAFAGDPPCWRVEPGCKLDCGGDGEPGCEALAQAVILAAEREPSEGHPAMTDV